MHKYIQQNAIYNYNLTLSGILLLSVLGLLILKEVVMNKTLHKIISHILSH